MRRDLRLGIAQVHDLRVAEAPEAETEVERRARDEHEIGLLQRDRSRTRERELVIGRQRAAAHAVDERRDPRLLDEARASRARLRPSRRRRPRRAPAGSSPRPASATRAIASRVGLGAARRARSTAGSSTSPGPNASSGMSTNVGPRCGVVAATARGVDLGHDRRRPTSRSTARLVTGRDDRHVVELLQRTGAPAGLRRAPGEHDHRRAVHPRRGHRAHAVGDARPGGDRGATEAAGHLRPALGREHRGLLVTRVDQPQARPAPRRRRARRGARPTA